MSIVVTICQLLVYLISTPPVRFFFRVQDRHSLETLKKISKNKGLILISNHISRLDPFVILSSLPFSVFYKLLPIHFMTASTYLSTWFQKLFLVPLGCYAHKGNHEGYSPIDKSIEYLDRDERVFIFPEGKRLKLGESPNPKRGVGMLVLQKNYSVIPIKIMGIEDLAINKVFARKARAVISVGPIISNQEARKISSDPQVIASELMRKVYELE